MLDLAIDTHGLACISPRSYACPNADLFFRDFGVPSGGIDSSLPQVSIDNLNTTNVSKTVSTKESTMAAHQFRALLASVRADPLMQPPVVCSSQHTIYVILIIILTWIMMD